MHPVNPTRHENPRRMGALSFRISYSRGRSMTPRAHRCSGARADGLNLVFSGVRIELRASLLACAVFCASRIIGSTACRTWSSTMPLSSQIRKAADLLEEHFRNQGVPSMVDLRFHLAVKAGQTVRR